MTDLYVTDLPADIERGVDQVESGKLDQAWNHFTQISQDHPESPLIQSYIGVLRIYRNKEVEEGLELCREAMKRDPEEALLYLNLSRAYKAAGHRPEAVQTIRRGLRLRSSYQHYLIRYYKGMGVRSKSPLKFLHRDHVVNKAIGKITWKLYRARKANPANKALV